MSDRNRETGPPVKKTPTTTPRRTAAEHETSVDVSPAPHGARGGDVTSRCTCGWTTSQTYTRDRFRSTAQGEADRLGRKHLEEVHGDA
jgi:hypothetical protein